MERKNTSKLPYKNIPLRYIEPELVFILLQISVIPEYDLNNKPTDNIVGYSYEVVNTDSFEKYKIKVLGKKPLMSPEELQKKRDQGEKIAVEFENATVKMYWNRQMNSYADTFSADGISLVTD